MSRRVGRRSARHRVASWTTLRDGSLPSAEWRPYPLASIYKPIPGTDDGSAGTPTTHADSALIVEKFAGTSGARLNPGQILPGQDSSATQTLPAVTHPVYYATAGDPVFEVRRRTDSGNNSPWWTTSSGPSFYCPQAALPARGTDRHMAVVQPDGTEWFIYSVASAATGTVLTSMPAGGGVIYGTGLSKHDITGAGVRLGGDGASTAAGWASLYGPIRVEEMIAGSIGHALFGTANWSNGQFVAPAVALARRKVLTTSGSHTFPLAAGTLNYTGMVTQTGASQIWPSTGQGRLPNGSTFTYTGLTGTAASGSLTGVTGGTGGVLATGSTVNEHQWPPNGARFQLNMTSAEIQALANSGNATGRPWNKILLEAMRRYGIFIGDTGGGNWSIHIESGQSRYALTGVDPWRTWAAGQGVTYDAASDSYFWDIRTVVDWSQKLRVLDWTDPANY